MDIQKGDFFYGAVLSALLSNGIAPALIEKDNKNRRIYKCATNDDEFTLILKYISAPTTDNDGYTSWTFGLEGDLDRLKALLDAPGGVSLCLIGGTKELNKSKYIALHREDIQEIIIDQGIVNPTFSQKKGEKAFRISAGGGRDNAIQIPTKRLY